MGCLGLLDKNMAHSQSSLATENAEIILEAVKAPFRVIISNTGKDYRVPENIIFVISASVIVLIRVISVKFHLELPKIKDDLFTKN